jgi:hypothetical protein
MIDVGNGKSVNPAYIVSCTIENIHYMNGSESRLHIVMADGSRIVRTHGWGIDIYKIKDAIELASTEPKEKDGGPKEQA